MPELEAASEPLARELDVATRAALSAGEEVMRLRSEGVRYGRKDGWELVSEADLRAAVVLHEAITTAFPGDGWLSEEHTDTSHRLGLERTWIVDPIDGTREFLSGIAEFSISVGLSVAGQPVLGVVHNPATGELFTATSINPIENAPGLTPPHMRALVGRGEHYHDEIPPLPLDVEAVGIGSVAYRLALVAAGKGDAVLTGYGRHEWDVAAGAALCHAAGLRVTDVLGAPLLFNQPDPLVRGLLVAPVAVHEYMLNHFRRFI